MPEHAARPFLKWAGGKRQLLPALRQYYPAAFGRYLEPFLGSGAVFFDLHARGALDGRAAVLTDTNRDLIGCYQRLRDSSRDIVRELEQLARGHAKDGASHYYEIRDRHFNPVRLRNGSEYSPALAAMFIYLNRTGYNGLFRLNADGAFNVPVGRYLRPKICDEPNLRRVSEVLRGASIVLDQRSFERVLDEARAGDFIYFDPPYAPLTRTANFTSYTAERFTQDDQRALRDIMVTLADRGCRVLMSNSTAREVAELYERDARVAAAGIRCYTVPARRAINSNSSRRGAVSEYIITNRP